MGKPPAQRERERRRAGRAQGRDSSDRRHSRRRQVFSLVLIIGIIAMLAATIIGSLAIGGSNTARTDDEPEAGATSTPETIAPPVELSVPEPGETITGETPCPAEDGSAPRVTSFEQPPPMCIDTSAGYRAVISTTAGDITALLDPQQAPQTVNNFVVLSRYHFYDGVPFFTIVPRTLIVTGDATGDPEIGQGGPGYTIPDEIPEAGTIYPFGTMAMWHGPGETDANGSRFFIATGDGAAALPPEFTTFGLVTDGQDAINAIQDVGDPTTGNPVEEMLVESIEITRLEEAPTDPSQPTTTTAAG